MKRCAAVLTCLLLLTGCTSALVYNRLDTLVAWYLEGLVTLNQSQRADLREWLGQTLDWHRDSELARYAQFVRSVSADAGDSANRATFERAEEQFRQFSADLAQRTAPDAAKFMLGLSDDQMDELIANLEERAQERLDEEQKLLKKNVWHKRRAKQITKQFKRWAGSIEPEQAALIRATADQLQPSYAEWLESQRAWRAALKQTFAKREHSVVDATEELTKLLTDPDAYWTPEYRRKQENNRARSLDLLVDLDATLIGEQRAELQRRLLKLAQDLESLAQNRASAT